MATEIIVAVISLLGTAVGTYGGIRASNKLMLYRLEQLEKKVEKHNNVVERMYNIEENQALINQSIDGLKDNLEQKIKVADHRIADLEEMNK